MRIIPSLVKILSRKERVAAVAALAVFFIAGVAKASLFVNEHSTVVPAPGGTYTEGMVGQPVAVNPVISADPVDTSLAALVYGKLGDFAEGIDVQGNTYTVRLKEGLKWGDGVPLTSDDVVFTVGLIQNPDAQSPWYKNFEGVTVTRVSELRVTFTLPASYVFFADTLRNLEVIPQHVFADVPPANVRLSDYNLEPISSGPYKVDGFTKRRDGFITEFRLTRNDAYAGDKPFIKNFVVKFYEDEGRLMQAYEGRQIDGFGTWDMPEATSTMRGVVDYIPTASYYAVFFNPEANTALANQTIRTALRNAIDKTELVKAVFGPLPATLSEGESRAVPVDGPDPYEAGTSLPDFASASSTLHKYVAKNGPLTIEITYPNVGFLEKTAEFVKSAWEQAGVSSVKLTPLDEGTFMNRVVRERNYETVLFGNVIPYVGDLFPFWHSSERFYPGLNLAMLSDKKLDTLLVNLREEPNATKRAALFAKAVVQVRSDSPAAFLYTVPYVYVHDEALQGFGVPEWLVSPADRFEHVTQWYVREVRVLNTASSTPR